MNDELMTLLESLKNTLVSRATGSSGDTVTFVTARRTIMAHPILRTKVPRWLKACHDLEDFWGMIKPKFARYHERREWIREELAPLFELLDGAETSPADQQTTLTLQESGSEYIRAHWEKGLERRERDPDGAITIARTLLEEVCRYVLDHEGEKYDEKADLPKLYSLTAKMLRLAPSEHTEDIVKQILGGCHSIVVGMGALRSRVGDAHAKGKLGARAAPRHAAFAVNIAGATASFILDTYEARKAEGTLR